MTTVPLGCCQELGITGDVDRGGVGRRGSSGGVDDVLDHADPAQRHGKEVVELHPWRIGRLEGVIRDHRRVVPQLAAAAVGTALGSTYPVMISDALASARASRRWGGAICMGTALDLDLGGSLGRPAELLQDLFNGVT